MHELVLARHGESEASARGLVGGDTPLTARGRAQATELASRLADVPIDVCLTSAALRARETAELALARRDIQIETMRQLGDIRFGGFEGGPLADYRDWIESHAPTEAPADGESRVQTLRRFGVAFREIAARPEGSILVVAHGLTVRALLDERPQPVVAGAAYGEPVRMTQPELRRAVDRLERWCESPSW